MVAVMGILQLMCSHQYVWRMENGVLIPLNIFVNFQVFYSLGIVYISYLLLAGTVLNQTTLILIAVVSSVGVLLLSCTVFCIIGYACVRRCRRQNLIVATTNPFQLSEHNDPVYEDVLPALLNQKKEYELNENVAYGPVAGSPGNMYDHLHCLN